MNRSSVRFRQAAPLEKVNSNVFERCWRPFRGPSCAATVPGLSLPGRRWKRRPWSPGRHARGCRGCKAAGYLPRRGAWPCYAAGCGWRCCCPVRLPASLIGDFGLIARPAPGCGRARSRHRRTQQLAQPAALTAAYAVTVRALAAVIACAISASISRSLWMNRAVTVFFLPEARVSGEVAA